MPREMLVSPYLFLPFHILSLIHTSALSYITSDRCLSPEIPTPRLVCVFDNFFFGPKLFIYIHNFFIWRLLEKPVMSNTFSELVPVA